MIKLPIEVSKQIHESREVSLGYEAIVRDCLEVCQPPTSELLLHLGEMTQQEIRSVAAALEYVRNKILVRYGLEKS